MNSKIIIAALDAGLINYIDNETPRRYYISGNADIEEVEKFAELIVKECANLAKTKSDSIVERAMKYAEDADEETSAKATAWQFLVFEQEIKKHFGVE